MTVGLAFLGVATLNLFFGPDPIPAALPKFLAGDVDLGIRKFQMYRVVVVALVEPRGDGGPVAGLNVAVGGNWPGPPDNTTIFPQQMLVDYVRVYRR